ncbi:MAG: ABC transporter permease, partial [Rhodospirillaceae bacterium]|nr:ABC transporter permease [Rhodospirillaceae bacterium]
MSALTLVFAGESVGLRMWRRFLRHRLAVTSALFLLVLGAIAFAAPLSEAVLGFDGEQV